MCGLPKIPAHYTTPEVQCGNRELTPVLCADSIESPEQRELMKVVCGRPARRRMQTVSLVSLVAVGSVAVIERYRQSISDGDNDSKTGEPMSAPGMRMTKAASLIALLVLSGTALLPAPQWLEEINALMLPELGCPVTGLSAAGVLPGSYDQGPNDLPSDVEERREACIVPARWRLVTVLLVSAVGVQSVAVLEYYVNRRRRNCAVELQDKKDLFASVED